MRLLITRMCYWGLTAGIVIILAGCGNDAPPDPAPPTRSGNSQSPNATPTGSTAATTGAQPVSVNNDSYRADSNPDPTRLLTAAEVNAFMNGSDSELPVSNLRMQLEAMNELPELDPISMDLPTISTPAVASSQISSNRTSPVRTYSSPSYSPPKNSFANNEIIDLDGPELSSDFDRLRPYQTNYSAADIQPVRTNRPPRGWNGYDQHNN